MTVILYIVRFLRMSFLHSMIWLFVFYMFLFQTYLSLKFFFFFSICTFFILNKHNAKKVEPYVSHIIFFFSVCKICLITSLKWSNNLIWYQSSRWWFKLRETCVVEILCTQSRMMCKLCTYFGTTRLLFCTWLDISIKSKRIFLVQSVSRSHKFPSSSFIS
jgi:hypothetical protein